jgi:hypothetical protein
MKPLLIAMLAAAVVLLLPTGSAYLNVKTFDGEGAYLWALGIYDPDADYGAQSDNPCLMVPPAFAVSPAYYQNLRIFPTAGVTVGTPQIVALEVPLSGIPGLEDCLFAVRGGAGEPCMANGGPSFIGDDCQWFYNRGLSGGAGSAVFMDNLLGPTEVAKLSTTTVGVEYCAIPSVVAAGGGFPFSGGDIACGGLGSYTFFADCLNFEPSVGSILAAAPIFLSPQTGIPAVDVPKGIACASQVGAPNLLGLNFVSEYCMKTDTIDVVSGSIAANQEDTDWFMDLQPLGALADLLWATNPANISNEAPGGTSSAC